jgi:lytic murein transglycosylase
MKSILAIALIGALLPAIASAQTPTPYRYATTTPRNCVDPAKFPAFLNQMRNEAAAQGVGQRGLAALNGLTFDIGIVSRDRGQKVFTQTFEEFSSRMVPPRLGRARQMMQKHAQLLGRIQKEFGVPPGLIVAIWGLETDFGAGLGSYSTLSALATLAYDCRRAQIYRAELIDALVLVQRGLLRPSQRGAWAGEIGQTQFMPSAYLKYAVNAQGGGGGDIISSPADALASTANFLRSKGWTPGAGWDEGQPNFNALLQWNSAPVYAKTLGLFADKIAAN